MATIAVTSSRQQKKPDQKTGTTACSVRAKLGAPRGKGSMGQHGRAGMRPASLPKPVGMMPARSSPNAQQRRYACTSVQGLLGASSVACRPSVATRPPGVAFSPKPTPHHLFVSTPGPRPLPHPPASRVLEGRAAREACSKARYKSQVCLDSSSERPQQGRRRGGQDSTGEPTAPPPTLLPCGKRRG